MLFNYDYFANLRVFRNKQQERQLNSVKYFYYKDKRGLFNHSGLQIVLLILQRGLTFKLLKLMVKV